MTGLTLNLMHLLPHVYHHSLTPKPSKEPLAFLVTSRIHRYLPTLRRGSVRPREWSVVAMIFLRSEFLKQIVNKILLVTVLVL